MASIKVRKQDGAEAGTVDVADAVFGVEPSEACVRSALNHFMASQRAGTHQTKTRGFVSGGGKKPYKQKGTGRARQGSIRSPQWRGGAIIFGPHPRDYSFHINHKVKRKAIQSAFSELVRTERLIAIDEINLETPKTKQLTGILKSLKLNGPTLLITKDADPKIALSARNLPFVKYIKADSPNIYDLLTVDYVVATKSALERLGEVFS